MVLSPIGHKNSKSPEHNDGEEEEKIASGVSGHQSLAMNPKDIIIEHSESSVEYIDENEEQKEIVYQIKEEYKKSEEYMATDLLQQLFTFKANDSQRDSKNSKSKDGSK